MAWVSKSEFQKQIFGQKQAHRLLAEITFIPWFHEHSCSTCNSFNKYSLSVYSVPHRAVGMRHAVPDRVENKMKKVPPPPLLWAKRDNTKMTLWRKYNQVQAWRVTSMGETGDSGGLSRLGGQWQSCPPSSMCLWRAPSELKPDFQEWAVHLDGCRPLVGLEFYSVHKGSHRQV